MEYGLGAASMRFLPNLIGVLILVLMEYGLGGYRGLCEGGQLVVLILVLMEYGLGVNNIQNNKAMKTIVLILVLMEYGLGALIHTYRVFCNM